ncbi:hypothetical protein JTE90_002651 [Oedothorax gibbosus]|uniref:Gustatory receptor n=1 Tax=Oedothorax gibbosus TaxID=931172 RepID=A0AAV6UCW4_9ARAC|nr:hypothetical protein JTE90_002651 [Oedothorax gibbosus]
MISFMICMSSFLTTCSVVGFFAIYSVLEMNYLMTIDILFSGILSTATLASIIWMAGQVPIETAAFREAFLSKIERRVCLGIAPDIAGLDRLLSCDADFVLTGGNIVRFQRSLILTIVGTVLTYTFLLITSNSTQ